MRFRFRIAHLSLLFLPCVSWLGWLPRATAQGRERSGPTLTERFDRDGNGRLDDEERAEAREAARRERRSRRPFGLRFGGSENHGPLVAGPRVSPEDVARHEGVRFYEPFVLRTVFLDFKGDDWEAELGDFSRTGVEVPATLTVDGKRYDEVGVRFRGSTSLMGVRDGQKRSLNLSIDWAKDKQRVDAYRTLEFLNAHGDPTFARIFLYYHIARHYLPAPRSNFVRVVINGESWGIYVNHQQYNRDFLKEWFGTRGGTRWKVVGDGRRRSFTYIGDDPRAYERAFELKTERNAEHWEDLVRLCEAIDETPSECVVDALEPLLDVDGVLWFLALDNVFVNADSYFYSRTSDFSLYRDKRGHFHTFPRDANETFQAEGRRGFRRPGSFGGLGGGRAGIELVPLAGADDPDMILIHRLLASPELRARYLAHVRTLVDEWLDWKKIGPIVDRIEKLIGDEVRKDTRKLESFAAFEKGLRDGESGLKTFVDERRKFLLAHDANRRRAPKIESVSHHAKGRGARIVAKISPADSGDAPRRVWLWYSAGREKPFERLEMLPATGTGKAEIGKAVYQANIPPQAAETTVRYYVEARRGGQASFFPRRTAFGARTFDVVE